jgi:dTDP-4-amino-4,6-dideoxygalactose transaminase
VIEDAAQSIGATYKGRPACSIGTCGCLSFFPSKNLGGLGDGGMVLTQDADFAERCAIMRNHGATSRYFHDAVGGNFRLDTIQGAYLSVKLRHLDAWSEGRRRNAARYNELLADVNEIATPVIAEHNVSIYNQYVIRAADRDGLNAFLGENNIGTSIYYPLSLHEQACFADLGYASGDLPHAEQAAKEVLALPIYPELTPQQLEHVADTIKRYYR